jgi:hypothetical protein
MDAERDSERRSSTRIEILRLHSKVGQNVKETRDIIDRLRPMSGSDERTKSLNPLPHWKTVLGSALYDSKVTGEVVTRLGAEENGINVDKDRDRDRDRDRDLAVNPPSRQTSLRRSGDAQLAWPHSQASTAFGEPEPVAVATLQENLKMATKVRQLERTVQALEDQVLQHKEGRRRAEEEERRRVGELEQQVEDLTGKLLARDKDLTGKLLASASTLPDAVHGAMGGWERGDNCRATTASDKEIKELRAIMSRLEEEAGEARVELEEERKRTTELTYSLERLRCDAALEIGAAHDAAAAARASMAAKGEECRALRKEVDDVKREAGDVKRRAEEEADKAAAEGARSGSKWKKLRAALGNMRERLPAGALVMELGGEEEGEDTTLAGALGALEVLGRTQQDKEALADAARKAQDDSVIAQQLLTEVRVVMSY